jgi:hypothetical protein
VPDVDVLADVAAATAAAAAAAVPAADELAGDGLADDPAVVSRADGVKDGRGSRAE